MDYMEISTFHHTTHSQTLPETENCDKLKFQSQNPVWFNSYLEEIIWAKELELDAGPDGVVSREEILQDRRQRDSCHSLCDRSLHKGLIHKSLQQ